jgi:hypothetical protein
MPIDGIIEVIETALRQMEDADVRAGMSRWISQFRAGGEEINERIYVSAVRALDPTNYGSPYPGNVVGITLAQTMATALVAASK